MASEPLLVFRLTNSDSAAVNYIFVCYHCETVITLYDENFEDEEHEVLGSVMNFDYAGDNIFVWDCNKHDRSYAANCHVYRNIVPGIREHILTPSDPRYNDPTIRLRRHAVLEFMQKTQVSGTYTIHLMPDLYILNCIDNDNYVRAYRTLGYVSPEVTMPWPAGYRKWQTPCHSYNLAVTDLSRDGTYVIFEFINEQGLPEYGYISGD